MLSPDYACRLMLAYRTTTPAVILWMHPGHHNPQRLGLLGPDSDFSSHAFSSGHLEVRTVSAVPIEYPANSGRLAARFRFLLRRRDARDPLQSRHLGICSSEFSWNFLRQC